MESLIEKLHAAKRIAVNGSVDGLDVTGTYILLPDAIAIIPEHGSVQDLRRTETEFGDLTEQDRAAGARCGRSYGRNRVA